MDNINEILIPSGTKYLFEVMKELPPRSIFDKGKVGGGGTYIALNNEHDYIITVPYISLITNKVQQNEEDENPNKIKVFGVYGKFDRERVRSIREYAENNKPRKFLVTYDSFEKLIDVLNGATQYKLLVDEYHLLFTQYAFREKAADTVLRNFSSFEDYCFMSATPLSEEFLLEEIIEADAEMWRAKWEDSKPLIIYSVLCNDLRSAVLDEIEDFAYHEKGGNAYFFVNSVDFIREIVPILQLDEYDTRVICAKKPENENVAGITNGEILSRPGHINFITSTAFEGADFYDSEGVTYIVSDGRREHTLTDISTTFVQISGRIRNAADRGVVTHLYTQTDYTKAIRFEEYKKECDKEIERAQSILDQYNNNIDDAARKGIRAIDAEYKYIKRDEDGFYSINRNRYKLDLYLKKLSQSLYANEGDMAAELKLLDCIVVKQYSESNREIKDVEGESAFCRAVQYLSSTRLYPDLQNSSQNNVIEDERAAAKEALGDDRYYEIINAANSAFMKWPFLENAIRLVGYERMEQLKYKVKSIKRETIIAQRDIEYRVRIKAYLDNEGFGRDHTCRTKKEIKEALQKAYRDCQIALSAKAREIENYYGTKRCEKNGQEGYRLSDNRIMRG